MKKTSTIWGLVCIIVGVVVLVVMSLLWGLGVWGPCASGTGCALSGVAGDIDRHFIEQMIPHHQMGVMMAQMVIARTDRPEIEELARSVIRTQTAEIEQMREWYRVWYE